MAVFWVCRVQTSETLVNSYQYARRYNPEHSHLHSYRCENLKSYIGFNAKSDPLDINKLSHVHNGQLNKLINNGKSNNWM
jgi:hypothetical protein